MTTFDNFLYNFSLLFRMIVLEEKLGVFSILNEFTYLLNPRSRVLLEKLTGFQLVKKFPTFYGTRMFITAVTSARQLSLF